MRHRARLRAIAACFVALGLVCAHASTVGRDVAPAEAVSPRVVVVGDSLAVGTEPFLGGLLRYRALTWDARSGRTTPEGLRALRGAVARVHPQTVVISLGTNDGPDPVRFADRIRRALAAIPPQACVVWATIYRPPRKGPYFALNRVLRATQRRDRRLVLVDWDRVVARGMVRLPDGLHPDPAGFLLRSRMIATAVYRGCAARPA
jgi:lysophospholipase L1-like esterase